MHDFIPVQKNLPLLAALLTQRLTSRQLSAKSQAMVVATVKDARKLREQWPVLLGDVVFMTSILFSKAGFLTEPGTH